MTSLRSLAFASGLALAAPAFAAPAPSALGEVDPFIGTGGEGHTFPGAVAPFGMVQLSPDTNTICRLRACYKWAAGYRYDDPTIQGFSHTHFSGAGHSDLADFLVMPAVGDRVELEPGDPAAPGSGYRSRFSHATEIASPGYYAVTLADSQVRAEMTAGTRIGVHRYTFPASAEAHLVLDLRTSLYDYPGKILWSSIRLRPDGIITGMRETRGWAPGRKLWFAMRFSAPIAGHRFVNTETDLPYKGFQAPAAARMRLPSGKAGLWSRGSISERSTARSRSGWHSPRSTRPARSPIWTASPAISMRSAPAPKPVGGRRSACSRSRRLRR